MIVECSCFSNINFCSFSTYHMREQSKFVSMNLLGLKLKEEAYWKVNNRHISHQL